VKRFVAEGAFVYVFARRSEELDKVAASLSPNVATASGRHSVPAPGHGRWSSRIAAIRVNTITPGPCDNPLIDPQVSSPKEATAVRTKVAASIPLGRMARPEEIAGAMLFLASEDSSFVAGSELLVDGGMCSVCLRSEIACSSLQPAGALLSGQGWLFHPVRGDFNAKAQRKSCRHNWWQQRTGPCHREALR
jgi:Enoyl-(Acyl carrier protein) reductase